MAISTNTAWEVRATGNDNNGGGYVIGSSGVDSSQQDAPALSLVDVVTTTSSATVTSATGGFLAAHVGNGINIAGTLYQVAAVASSTSLTVDRTVAAGATGQVGKVGGALASPAKALAAAVTGNLIWLKGSFATAATLASSAGGATAATPPNRMYGYASTRGDGGKATLTAAAGCATVLAITGGSWWLASLTIDCAGIAGTGILMGQWHHVTGCLVKNFTAVGVSLANQFNSLLDSEVTGGTAAATAAVNVTSSNGNIVSGNTLHGNSCPGVVAAGGGLSLTDNLIYANTGTAADGINISGYANLIERNTLYGNGRDGIRFTAQVLSPATRGNLITGNGGYGMNFAAVGSGNGTQTALLDGNAFYNNTSGPRLGCIAGPHDVTLTADPFVSAASGNFALNSAAGGGTLCRAAGLPGAFPAGATTGYPDIGAAQHADPAGGAGGLRRIGFTGGIGG